VEAVQRKGVRVTVVSTVRSQPAMIADELRRQADLFVDITALQEDIERAQRRDYQRTRARVPLEEEPYGDEPLVDDEEDEEDEDYYESQPA
jgi:hypothetical protein